MEIHAFSGKLCVGLLIIHYHVFGLLPAAVVCCYGWMVRDLLWQELKVICDKLIGLTQQRIERFVGVPFTDGQLRDCVNSHICKPVAWIIFHSTNLIKDVVVLHWLSALLQQTSWIIEVHWNRQLWDIFSNGVLDDCPYAYFNPWIFKPWKFCSFLWFIWVN